MRVLIVHNQLWAHYKSKLFTEIHGSLQRSVPGSSMLVAQIALYEASRKQMQNKDDRYNYEYPYEVLHPTSLDQVSFFQRLSSLFKIYKTFRPTVLNITGYFDWAQVLLMFYARLNGVKVVLSSESSSGDHQRSFIKEAIKRMIVNSANACFCFGSSSAEYLRSLGVSDLNIPVRHAAVIDEDVIRLKYNEAKATHPSSPPAFIYVGRMASEKNLLFLINAFLDLNKSHPGHGWLLRLVGAGPLENEITSLSAQHTNIIMEGSHAWYQIPAFLAKSTVLVLPSISEPWGLVVNEAMVCGLPVLVSESCGCAPDLVREQINGFTFSPENTLELTQKLGWLIDHPEALPLMGRASIELVKPFASQSVADEMVATYCSLNQK